VSQLFCESYLRFALPDGSRHHEDVNPGNTGVDLEIASTPAIWLEVKNWDSLVIPEWEREKQEKRLPDRTKVNSVFWNQLLRKFEGTYRCLNQLGEVPDIVTLAVLLQSRLITEKSLAPMNSILQSKIASSPALSGKSVIVVDIAQANRSFPEVEVANCSGSGIELQWKCLEPLPSCSVKRRDHQ